MAARKSPVPDWVPDDLPRSPGVYHFVDALGSPIYIGKSINVRRRVRGYFYGGGPVSMLTLQLETVWLREWTADFMPSALRQALGIPARPTEG